MVGEASIWYKLTALDCNLLPYICFFLYPCSLRPIITNFNRTYFLRYLILGILLDLKPVRFFIGSLQYTSFCFIIHLPGEKYNQRVCFFPPSGNSWGVDSLINKVQWKEPQVTLANSIWAITMQIFNIHYRTLQKDAYKKAEISIYLRLYLNSSTTGFSSSRALLYFLM